MDRIYAAWAALKPAYLKAGFTPVKHVVTLALSLCACFEPISAQARSYDSRPFDHFARKNCVSAACFRKHPSGSYTFPYHDGHRHS